MASCHPKLSPLHLRACATRWGADCLRGADSIRTPIRTSETFPEDPPRPSQWPPLTERLTRRKDLRTHARWPFLVPFPVPFLFNSLFHPLDCTPYDALRRSPDPSPGPSSSTMAFDPRTHRGCACVGAGTRIYPHGSTHTGEAERVSPCDRRDVAVHASTHTYNVLALTSAHTISLTKQIPILPTYG